MVLKIPETIDIVLKTLEKNGFEAYIVGGCVRDLLMNTEPHDFDITTNALPCDVQRLFERTVDTGIKHGTVTVIMNGTPIEVTTYRTESGYSDSRRPDSVSFVGDIREDLSRRDFTVNAICYNPRLGLLDCFGGIEDIEKKQLKAVGEPKKRFSEDALRILRLFRFASTLGFTPDNNTILSAIDCSKGLEIISRERISAELIKTILGNNPEALKPLIDCGGLKFLSIERSDKAEIISRLSKNERLRIYAFIKITCGDDAFFLRELKLSNAIKKYYELMKKTEEMGAPKTRAQIKRLLNSVDFSMLCDRMEYLNVFEGIDISSIVAEAENIIKTGEPYKISQLNISGSDILAEGIKGGQVGIIFNRLLDVVIDNPSLNEKKKLIKYIKNY